MRRRFKPGDIVLHKYRKEFFYNPQTIGIVLAKVPSVSNYICYEVWGTDWTPNYGYKFLAVLEGDLERVE